MRIIKPEIDSNTDNIQLIPKLNITFYNKLRTQTNSLLGEYTPNNKYEYSIEYNSQIIGVLIVDQYYYIRIAIESQYTNKNIAVKVIELLKINYDFQRFGWDCKIYNYPSLKFLYNIGGGILKPELNHEFIYGFLDTTKSNINQKQYLQQLLPIAKELYSSWLNDKTSKYYITEKILNEITKNEIVPEQFNISDAELKNAIIKNFNINFNIFYKDLINYIGNPLTINPVSQPNIKYTNATENEFECELKLNINNEIKSFTIIYENGKISIK